MQFQLIKLKTNAAIVIFGNIQCVFAYLCYNNNEFIGPMKQPMCRDTWVEQYK